MNNKKWYIKIWDEGEYFDLWSLTHFMLGLILAKITHLIKMNFLGSIFFILFLITVWEIIEIKLNVRETQINRILDIILGLCGFFVFFYFTGITGMANTAFAIVFFIPSALLGLWGYVAYLIENGQNKTK